MTLGARRTSRRLYASASVIAIGRFPHADSGRLADEEWNEQPLTTSGFRMHLLAPGLQQHPPMDVSARPSAIRAFFEWFGELGLLWGRAAGAFIRPPYEFGEFLRHMDNVGAQSAPLVAVAGAAIGVVLSLETRNSLISYGAESALPAIITLSVIRETGPIITALIVSGRIGAGFAAAIGSMRVTDQIDALEVSGVDPYRYLVATRIAACMLMLPLLTLVCDASAIVTGWVVNTLAEPITFKLFLNQGFQHVTFNDLLPPTIKTTAFGALIAATSSFQGMRARGGTEGVGRAVTNAVVLSSLFVIVADVVLVRLILVFFP
jgi:phospholipid/cholesterol/gamma-HCH transport system permease protein